MAGLDPRVLSRRPGEGRVTGDLRTGAGLDAAVRGASVILHCATAPRGDTAAAAALVAAARRGGDIRHLVHISIVGVDRVPLTYYREKLAVERLVKTAGLPWTILRATQFHDLLVRIFSALRRSPVLPVLAGVAFQPVDVRDVAARLVELALGDPAGRVPDLGGPGSARWPTSPAPGWTRLTTAVPLFRCGCPVRSSAATARVAPRPAAPRRHHHVRGVPGRLGAAGLALTGPLVSGGSL